MAYPGWGKRVQTHVFSRLLLLLVCGIKGRGEGNKREEEVHVPLLNLERISLDRTHVQCISKAGVMYAYVLLIIRSHCLSHPKRFSKILLFVASKAVFQEKWRLRESRDGGNELSQFLYFKKKCFSFLEIDLIPDC